MKAPPSASGSVCKSPSWNNDLPYLYTVLPRTILSIAKQQNNHLPYPCTVLLRTICTRSGIHWVLPNHSAYNFVFRIVNFLDFRKLLHFNLQIKLYVIARHTFSFMQRHCFLVHSESSYKIIQDPPQTSYKTVRSRRLFVRRSHGMKSRIRVS